MNYRYKSMLSLMLSIEVFIIPLKARVSLYLHSYLLLYQNINAESTINGIAVSGESIWCRYGNYRYARCQINVHYWYLKKNVNNIYQSDLSLLNYIEIIIIRLRAGLTLFLCSYLLFYQNINAEPMSYDIKVYG